VRIAYGNASYKKNDKRGKSAHIHQFITQTTNLGHEVWAWPGNQHEAVHCLPRNRLRRWWVLRKMDVLYIRLQETMPDICRYSLNPYHQAIGSPLVVWEFNTIPKFLQVMGKSQEAIDRNIQAFQHFGRGCDLAICVSKILAEYVQEVLGIQQVLIVPNGSDPELFYKDGTVETSTNRKPDPLNVVWIGSAELSWHNFELLISAAKQVAEIPGRAHIQFHLIGPKFAPTGDSLPNVHYHGGIDYKDLPRWLAHMDVGLCLYHPGPADFGSPLKLFDYMASGLTVVGTVHPQVNEVFGQLNQLDLLVLHDDTASLVDILLNLDCDRDRVRQLGNAGRQLVISYFNWKRAAREVCEAIEVKLNERKRGGLH
jgi:glycosyltransferase involved in cell wall biosynthesis